MWAENKTYLQNVSIIETFQIIPTRISLIHYPYLSKLLIKTDIQLQNIINLTKFQIQSVVLLYDKNLPSNSDCRQSNFTSSNPADFGGYSSSTNFTSLSQTYTYTVLNQSVSQSQYNISSNQSQFLILMIDNILIDCTVNIQIDFPNGQLLNNNQNFIFFNQITNQTVTYIEQIVTVNVVVQKYTYFKQLDLIQIQLTPQLQNIYWDMTGLNNYDIITYYNGIPCILQSTSHRNNYLQLYCKNTTQIYLATVLQFNFPNQYIRQQTTNRLLNFVVAQPNWLTLTINVQNNCSTSITYYIKEQKLDIIIDFKVQSHWINILITDNINITIDGNRLNISLVSFKKNPLNFIEVQARLQYPLNTSNVQVSLCNYWSLTTPQGYNVFYLFPVLSPPITILPSQFITTPYKQNFKKFTHFIFQTVKFTNFFSKGWEIFLFSYFINNFIAFQNLSFLYYFAKFKFALHYYRKDISDIVKSIQQNGGYQYFLQNVLNIQFRFKFSLFPQNNFDPASQILPLSNSLNFLDYGYSTYSMTNSIQYFVLLIILGLKLILLKFISNIPCRFIKVVCLKILKHWKQILFFEIIIISPQYVVMIGWHFQYLYQTGFQHFVQKANLLNSILVSLMCTFCIILLYLKKTNKNRPKPQPKIKIFLSKVDTQQNFNINNNLNANKRSSQLIFIAKSSISKKNKQVIHLIDYLMYIIIPLFVGIGQVAVFILVMKMLTIVRFVLIIKNIKKLTKLNFISELLNKVIWILFTLVYLIYQAIQIINFDCYSNQTCINIISICDLIQSFLFVGGCLIQIILVIINALYNIFDVCFQYRKFNKFKLQQTYQKQQKHQIQLKISKYSDNISINAKQTKQSNNFQHESIRQSHLAIKNDINYHKKKHIMIKVQNYTS